MKTIVEKVKEVTRKETLNTLKQATNNFDRKEDAKSWRSLVEICKLIVDGEETLKP